MVLEGTDPIKITGRFLQITPPRVFRAVTEILSRDLRMGPRRIFTAAARIEISTRTTVSHGIFKTEIHPISTIKDLIPNRGNKIIGGTLITRTGSVMRREIIVLTEVLLTALQNCERDTADLNFLGKEKKDRVRNQAMTRSGNQPDDYRERIPLEMLQKARKKTKKKNLLLHPRQKRQCHRTSIHQLPPTRETLRCHRTSIPQPPPTRTLRCLRKCKRRLSHRQRHP